MSILTVPNWSRRRYSYAAMLAATGLGLAFPAAAGAVLWPPLAVGMVVLGVAHGACDQLVVPASPALRATAARGWRYWLHFLLSYLGLATVVGALWWLWPAATVAGFFLLTIWHWGSADAPAVAQVPSTGWWLGHSLLRGLLVFAVPSWWWPTETSAIVNELLAFTGAAPVSAAIFERVATALIWLVAGGQLGLWGLYAGRGERQLVLAEATEILVLTAMFVTLPPRLALGVYFVFWHSLQHVLRLNGWLGYAAARKRAVKTDLLPQLLFFLRRAAPLLLVSCAALLVLGYLLAARLPNEAAWFSLALVIASIVTLPHALLVTLVMDAPQWLRLGRRVAPMGSASQSA